VLLNPGEGLDDVGYEIRCSEHALVPKLVLDKCGSENHANEKQTATIS
jgi:hypothetical protein